MDTGTEAYVDTSALVALGDRSDTHHVTFRRLFAAPPKLVTTPLVIAEGHAWFLRRYDGTRALQFLAMIEAMAPLHVVAVGAAEQSSAFALLRRYPDRGMTITDALGLHVMRERRVRMCWSADRHLAITGVPLAIDLDR